MKKQVILLPVKSGYLLTFKCEYAAFSLWSRCNPLLFKTVQHLLNSRVRVGILDPEIMRRSPCPQGDYSLVGHILDF